MDKPHTNRSPRGYKQTNGIHKNTDVSSSQNQQNSKLTTKQTTKNESESVQTNSKQKQTKQTTKNENENESVQNKKKENSASSSSSGDLSVLAKERESLQKCGIGDFKVLAKCGEGCDGIVLAVNCLHPDHPDKFKIYALKVMYFGVLSSRTVSMEFNNENAILSTIKPHKNIVSMWAVFRDVIPPQIRSFMTQDILEIYKEHKSPKSQYMIFDFYKWDLDTFMKNRSMQSRELDIQQKILFYEQVLNALVHLQTQRIVHRDLKLNNILINDEDEDNYRVVICDFGCAVLCSEEFTFPFRTGMSPGGNVSHLAPEVLNVNNNAMYSIQGTLLEMNLKKQSTYEAGVLLYEILCGIHPIPNYPYDYHRVGEGGSTTISYGNEVISRIPPHLLGEKFSDFAMSMVTSDPSSRPTLKQARKIFKKYKNALRNSPRMLINSHTLFCDGENSYFGNGTKKNFGLAFQKFNESAKLGHPRALAYVGFFYTGILCPLEKQEDQTKYRLQVCGPIDTKRAFESFSLSSDAKDPLGYAGIAFLFEYGLGVPKDTCKSSELFNLALAYGIKQDADAENMLAQYFVGMSYLVGWNTQVVETATLYLKLSAAQGNVHALYTLGAIYHHGTGGAQLNYEAVVTYYTRASDQGNAYAQYNLGTMYHEGVGVEQDYYKAASLFELAADQGHIDAQFKLGLIYLHGFDGLDNEVDYDKARYFFELAAEKENANAQCNLGIMYDKALGVEQDFVKAFRYYKLAADQGNPNAQFNLGVMYFHGLGVEQDYSKAASLFKLAADQGNADAQCNLGYMFRHGQGVKQDYEMAVKLFELSSSQGNACAQYNLGALYQDGFGLQRNYEKAFALYKMAADQEDSDAQFSLGTMYENGWGVQKDPKTAAEFFEASATQGNANAQAKLTQYNQSRSYCVIG